MAGKSTTATVSEIAIAGLFAYWGWHHPFWGMSAIPAALVAVVIGNLLIVVVLLILLAIGAGIAALVTR